MTHSEAKAIRDEARQNYIKRYGVDPRNPRAEILNGEVMSKEKVRRLVEQGKASPGRPHHPEKSDDGASTNAVESGTGGGTTGGPSQAGGDIYLTAYPASDAAHSPDEAWSSGTQTAWFRFGNEFGVTTWYSEQYGVWDASGTGDNTRDQLDDLVADVGPSHWEEDETYLGWVATGDHNGRGKLDQAGSVCATSTSSDWSAEWGHEQIAQHEISHNFNAPDRGRWGYEHQECIMNSEWAYRGTTIWGSEDWDIVNDNITA